MADSLINLLRPRTLLIRAGGAVGTGTLIAPGMVLTCAHVVRQSLSEIETIEVLLPDLTRPGHFVWTEKAIEVFVSEKYEEQRIGTGTTESRLLTTEYPDVAVLRISKTEHPIIAFPRYGEVPEDFTEGQFLAFGFQKKDRDLLHNVPQAVSLNYSGEQVDGAIQKLMFTNGLIRPGMSGAALMNRESGKIVGIVHMTMSAQDDLGAYVIPVEKIWDVIKLWEEEGINSLFSLLQSKEHKTKVQKEYRQEYPLFPMYRKYGMGLIVLPILIFLALWWMFFHLGSIQDSGLISIVLVAISISGKLIGDWLGEKMNTESTKLKTGLGNILFGTPFLIIFATVIAALWTFTSSVWVYGNSELGEKSITLYSDSELKEGTQKNLDLTGKTRFFMFTSPIGDSVALVPEGNEAKKILIKSFSKKEFYYPRDFRLEPAFLVRFDYRYSKRKLMDDYQIRIEIERAKEKIYDTVYDFMDETSGSITLGRNFDITRRVADWEQELRDDASVNSIERIEEIVDIWSKTEYIPKIDLAFDDRITVKVIRKKFDSIYNEETYSIRKNVDVTDKLLDIKIKQSN